MDAIFNLLCRKSALRPDTHWGWFVNGLCSMSAACRGKEPSRPAGRLGGRRYQAREGSLLALVGDGPHWDQVHARVQTHNLADCVYLAGRQSDVATWYRGADFT